MQTPRTLLIVEDDQVLSDLLVLCLEDKNLHAIAVSDAYYALEVLGDELPSLIVLDVNLPGMNGLRFLQELENRGLRHIPVIVTSADPYVEEQLRDEGVAGFIPKPFDIEQCNTLITRALGKAKSA